MERKPRQLAGKLRPGLMDVARLAGVSHQTVSRVVNGQPNVKSTTLEKVVKAMRHLGYEPNTAARVLVTGRSQTLGVICLDTQLLGPASVLFSLEQTARKAGFFVNITAMETLDAQSIQAAVVNFRRQAVAGVVIISPMIIDGTPYKADFGVPTVGVWGPASADIPLVGVTHQATGSVLATEYLLELGHKTVFHVAGPSDWLGSEARTTAWRQVLQKRGIDPPPVLSGDWSSRSGFAAGMRIAADPAATAVFVANDQMALGLIRALSQVGKRVPEDVSVVGFDNVPDAAYYAPPLTTVEQDFHLLGRQGMELLLREMGMTEPASSSTEFVLPCRLIVRQSAAAPPIAVAD